MGSIDRRQPLAQALPVGTGDQLSVSGDGTVVASSNRYESALWDISGRAPERVDVPVDLLLERQGTFDEPEMALQLQTLVVPIGDGQFGLQQFTVGEAEVYDGMSFESSSTAIQNFGSDGASSVSPDGRFIAYGVCAVDGDYFGLTSVYEGNQTCGYSGVNVANMADGAVVARLRPGQTVVGLNWSSASDRLLHVDDSESVTLWETETWGEIESLSFGSTDTGVRVARYSPDDEYLVTVDELGLMSFRDPQTGNVLRTIAGAAGVTNTAGVSIAFSRDGELMVTSFDGNIRLWDVASGSQIGVSFPHDVGVIAGFAESGILQLVTSVGPEMLIWNLDTSTWSDIACHAAGRNMTRAEWEQFGPRDTEYRATCPEYEITQ
jgi:WD40 repeat protein